MKDNFIKLFSTFFYTGYFPIASGTYASAFAAAIAVLLHNYLLLYVLFFAGMTILGFTISGEMERIEGRKDPGSVVIDEVAGIGLTFFLLPVRWDVSIAAFFLFRAFDMFKIYPANKFENLGGSKGIMMDDIMAGIYANVVMQIAIRWAGII